MSGFITILDKGMEKEFEFWVENDPKVYLNGEHTEFVNVQLDGHELEYLLENFQNIPHSTTKRVQIWYGDIGKFIVENWKL